MGWQRGANAVLGCIESALSIYISGYLSSSKGIRVGQTSLITAAVTGQIDVSQFA
jgi:hypothetical protein